MNQVYLGENEQIYLCEYNFSVSAPSLLILPNVGWYHVGPNRMFSQIAAQCIDNKMNCFCFDYIGSGESYGTFDFCSYQNMMTSYYKVYNYIIENYNNDIFVLGYGAGNILLKEIESKMILHGVIYYLPHFEDILKYKDVIYNDKLAKKNGYYDIKLSDNKNNYIFWRGILGEIHDCTYNYIKYDFLGELCQKLLENISVKSLAKHRLVISEEEINNDNLDVLLFTEFKNNILPEDWYKTVNLWPNTLYKTYCGIIEWIIKNTNVIKNNVKLNTFFTKNVISKKMIINSGFREIVSFNSSERTLFGVLNMPKSNDKKFPCVIFIPGLGGDKVDNFMCGPRLGDQMSNNDIAIFRYDNRFSGATANTLTDFTWTDVIEDFKNAISALETYSDRIDLNKIILVSWSNGAKLLSYIVSNKICSVLACCFWNPVFIDMDISEKFLDKKNMGKNMTRYKKNSQGQLVTQIGGEYLGMSFNIDNKKYDFLYEFNSISIPIKFIWGSQDVESAEYEYIENMKQNNIVESFIIISEHHLFSYELLELVIRETVDYIKKF